jgi:hypothetical protein
VKGGFFRAVAFGMAVLFASAPASAQSTEAERPWAKNVPEPARKQALELFQQGNEKFLQKNYREAADIYALALAQWQHPRIHGNLAVSLIHRGRPGDALKHIEAALA